MRENVYIITGSSGIAAETIKLIVSQGSKVFYIGKTESQCVDLQNEIKSIGFHADYIAGDLTDPAIAVQLVKSCMDKYGRIDGLFNVAGTSGRKYGDGPLHECTEEGWRNTISNNLTIQYRMSREVINCMLRQEVDEDGLRGTIVNMSSVLGISPEPKYFSAIAYATSKGAIISMSKTAASFYAKDKIRINVIAPGLTLTRMSTRATENEEIVRFMAQKQPLVGDVMSAENIAEVAVFLLNKHSKVITGQTIIVDAGWSVSG